MAFFATPACQKRFSCFAVISLCMFGNFAASAQDIRGLEICTAEKDLTRRTSCLQSNVELLQQELTKQARRAQDDRAATAKDTAALKADLAKLKSDLAALTDALAKAQTEVTQMKKTSPAEKK
jgi:hypothetical protein